MIDKRGESGDEPREDKDMSEEKLREELFKLVNSLPPEVANKLAQKLGFADTEKKSNELYRAFVAVISEKKSSHIEVLMSSARLLSMALDYARAGHGEKAFGLTLKAFFAFLQKELKIKLKIEYEGAQE